MLRKILATRGASTNMPQLDVGQLAFQSDTKKGVLGDGTAAGATFPTSKTTGAVDFSLASLFKFLRAKVGLGTVGSPSLIVGDDNSTGMYSPAAGVLGASAAGVEVWRADSTALTVSKPVMFTSTSHVKLSAGTTAQRPGTGNVAALRFNTQTGQGALEYQDMSGAWNTVAVAGNTVGINNYGVTSGTNGAFTVTLDNPIATLTPGFAVVIKMHATNTVSATLNVNGIGPRPILRNTGTDIQASDMMQQAICVLHYDDTVSSFRLVFSSSNSSSSSSTSGSDTIITELTGAEAITTGDLVANFVDGKVRRTLPPSSSAYALRPLTLSANASNVRVDEVINSALYTGANASGDTTSTSEAIAATLPNGNVVAVGLASTNAVAFVIYGSDGAPVLAQTPIPTSSGYNVGITADYNPSVTSPAVYVFSNGNFMVTWADASQQPHYAVYTQAGVQVKAATAVNTATVSGLSLVGVKACLLYGGDYALVALYYAPSGGSAQTVQTVGSTVNNAGVIAATNVSTQTTTTLTQPTQTLTKHDAFYVVPRANGYVSGYLRLNGANHTVTLVKFSAASAILGTSDVDIRLADGTTNATAACWRLSGGLGLSYVNITWISQSYADIMSALISWQGTITTPLAADNAFTYSSTLPSGVTPSNVGLWAKPGTQSTRSMLGACMDATNGFIRLYTVNSSQAVAVTADVSLAAYQAAVYLAYVRFSTAIVELPDGQYMVTGQSPTGVWLFKIDSTWTSISDVQFFPASTLRVGAYTNTIITLTPHPEFAPVTGHYCYALYGCRFDGTNRPTLYRTSIATMVMARSPLGVATTTTTGPGTVNVQIKGQAITRYDYSPGFFGDYRGLIANVTGNRLTLIGKLALLNGVSTVDGQSVRGVSIILGINQSWQVPSGLIFKGRISPNSSGGLAATINGTQIGWYNAFAYTGDQPTVFTLSPGDVVTMGASGALAIYGELRSVS